VVVVLVQDWVAEGMHVLALMVEVNCVKGLKEV
jgi:hypothetical protein